MQTETMSETHTFEGNPVKIHHIRLEMPQKRMIQLWLCLVPTPDDGAWSNEKAKRFLASIGMTDEVIQTTLAVTAAVNQSGVAFLVYIAKPGKQLPELVHEFEIAARKV